MNINKNSGYNNLNFGKNIFIYESTKFDGLKSGLESILETNKFLRKLYDNDTFDLHVHISSTDFSHEDVIRRIHGDYYGYKIHFILKKIAKEGENFFKRLFSSRHANLSDKYHSSDTITDYLTRENILKSRLYNLFSALEKKE